MPPCIVHTHASIAIQEVVHQAETWNCKSQQEGGSLVGVGMVVVVLDAPGLKGVDEGHEHKGAHNVLH